jgi:hypothetical protein
MSHRPRGVAVAPAVAVALGLSLLAPPDSPAARLVVPGQCYYTKEAEGRRGRVTVVGSDFSPLQPALVVVQDARTAARRIQADSRGAFFATFLVPRLSGRSIGPRTFTVVGIDINPQNRVQPASFDVAARPLASNVPVDGRPKAAATWQFAGFEPNSWIYGHFRFRGTTQRNYRFGRASGDTCGSLSVRAPRIPVRVAHRGRWRLQIDGRPTYRRKTMPRLVVDFTILRPPRLGR